MLNRSKERERPISRNQVPLLVEDVFKIYGTQMIQHYVANLHRKLTTRCDTGMTAQIECPKNKLTVVGDENTNV